MARASRATTSSRSPAPSGVSRVEENVGALGVTLTADDLAELDAIEPAGDRSADMGFVERDTPPLPALERRGSSISCAIDATIVPCGVADDAAQGAAAAGVDEALHVLQEPLVGAGGRWNQAA